MQKQESEALLFWVGTLGDQKEPRRKKIKLGKVRHVKQGKSGYV